MSRGIRDLRDLICVSRLTVRHSDDELFSSDEDNNVLNHFEELSLSSAGDTSRDSSAASRKILPSPDSGIATNGNSPQDSTENVQQQKPGCTIIQPHPPPFDDSMPRSFRKKKKKKKKIIASEPTRHELPKQTPLPPVLSTTHSRPSSSSSESTKSIEVITPSKYVNRSMPHPYKDVAGHTNFDEMLTYLDATVISEWLQTSNRNVTDIAKWCHGGENFVHFAHFWLSQVPDIQKHEFFKLEHSIIVDNLNFCFAAGRSQGQLKHKDLVYFVKAIFREYPEKLLSLKGSYLFLDYLDILSSERHDSYKSLLADVKCSTRVKQHAQWVLALRAFTLVSVWLSGLNFYRKLLTETGNNDHIAEPVPLAFVNKDDPNQVRMYHAIRNGFTDVVQYLIRSNKVDALYRDLHQKNLLFTAVMLNQPKVLQFLLNNIKPCPNVNAAADTGNTPLHAAANSGNSELVSVLLRAEGININVTNVQCDSATPLHLAVMHGHLKVVEQLVRAGADVHMKMGDETVFTIAADFQHDNIVTFLKSKS